MTRARPCLLQQVSSSLLPGTVGTPTRVTGRRAGDEGSELGRSLGIARHSQSFITALAIALFTLLANRAHAQAAWEFTPYQARIWIAQEATPQLPASLPATLQETLPARIAATWGGVLTVEVAAAPSKLRCRLLAHFDQLTADMVASAVDPKELETDKIFLTALHKSESGYLLRMRELDCPSRQVGPLVEISFTTLAALPNAVTDALAESFTPLARIELVDDGKLSARLRAGGLIADPDSPANVEPGMVLRPVIRRNDRSGQPAKGGVQAIPWSFLTVDERHDSTLECTLRSGFRAAIPARGGVRIQRFALLVRPRLEATRLVLRSRGDQAKPLTGYEIHRRPEGESQDTQLLGTTDSRGELTIPRGNADLETLVVKNGRQLLARLPLVPGYEESLTAYMVDDDGRLAAEGFVAALTSRVIDLVARREILAAQIRARVKDGKLDDAQKLLDDFRRLNTRADLTRDLDQFRQQVATGDKTTQLRIDRVFADAQKLLLLKPLSDELLASLTREVTAARTPTSNATDS